MSADVCGSCGSSEFIFGGMCYSAECPAYLASKPNVEHNVPPPAPGYENHDDEADDLEDPCR